VRIAPRTSCLPIAIALVAAGLTLAEPGVRARAATVFCAQPVTGAKIKWVGGHGSSWSNGRNWSGGVAPDASQARDYRNQYVCIGRKANVTLGKGKLAFIAGLDLGQGASLTLAPGAQLFLGAPPATPTVPSIVESGSVLRVIAATLGGNARMRVVGDLHLTGKTIGTKRQLDNFGRARFSGNGYVSIDDGGEWIDEPRSLLSLGGAGGIYQGAINRTRHPAALIQRGRLFGAGRGVDVIGVPTSFFVSATVNLTGGGVVVDAPRPPAARLSRGTAWGSGGCQQVRINLCHGPNASPADSQVAFATTSREAGSPRHQKIRVAIGAAGPRHINGHRVLGHVVKVTAPTGHTSHSTHLHFFFDASVRGVTAHKKPTVWRNGHKITYCAVHRLTARNPSCVTNAEILHHGPTKGDLEIMVITIQPRARWLTS
jgi:hypothetical protein